MSPLLAMLGARVIKVALKGAVACGLAYYLGSLLPSPIDEYKYYAALGAFTVVGLAVADSIKETFQVTGAVGVGVAVAIAAQSISWANSVTVAVTIALCFLLGSIRVFGLHGTWAPLAGLFVLAAGGANPEPMALGYLVQLPLGAIVGALVNALLFAPLGEDEIEPAADETLTLLSRQMANYADLLEDQRRNRDDPDAADRRGDEMHANVVALEDVQTRLRSAIIDARRAEKGNPRARLHTERREAILDRAEAVNRCSATLMAVGVVMAQSSAPEDRAGISARLHAVRAMRRASAIFADPEKAQCEPEIFGETKHELEEMLACTREATGDGLDDVLLGALAVTINDCLETFARHVAEVDPEDCRPA